MSNHLNKVVESIRTGDLQKAIDMLLGYSDILENEDYHNMINLISFSYHDLKKRKISGLDNNNESFNQIAHSILSLIKILETDKLGKVSNAKSNDINKSNLFRSEKIMFAPFGNSDALSFFDENLTDNLSNVDVQVLLIDLFDKKIIEYIQHISPFPHLSLSSFEEEYEHFKKYEGYANFSIRLTSWYPNQSVLIGQQGESQYLKVWYNSVSFGHKKKAVSSFLESNESNIINVAKVSEDYGRLFTINSKPWNFSVPINN